MNIKVLFKTHPRLLVGKVRRKVRTLLLRRFRKTSAGLKSTYSDVARPGCAVEQLYSPPAHGCLDVAPPNADSVISHIFDLLGSGPVNVRYGLQAGGFKKFKYPALNADLDFDSEGLWLGQFINRTNIACSRRIWRFLRSVNPGYKPIDWQLDFKSGYRWDNATFFTDIRIGHRPGVDVKVPWELSRFQHLSALGQAYTATGDEKYALECVCQILDWIATNPPLLGVNWACTMDVAIRAANWLFWLGHIRDWLKSQSWHGEFCRIFSNSLYDHLKFIPKNLERIGTLTTNHYLADIAGLLVIASSTEDIFAESRRLREFAVSQLRDRMLEQFNPDGTNFEASTCYHRLALEIVFYAVWYQVVRSKNFDGSNYCDVTEGIFGAEFTERLYKAFEVVLYLVKPNGKMPQIGDNDSGQFVKLRPREVLDMRYLLGLGGVFFKEPRFKIKEFFERDEDLYELKILYGARGYEIWSAMESSSLTGVGSIALSDAGWYVMRDAKDYCIIFCGPNGQNGNGGHCHNDKLSFELCIDGRDVVVDPGTYVYTADPKARNRFRATARHNTVVVDGQEQSRFDPKNLFTLGSDAPPRCLKWETGEEVHIFVGEDYGFGRLARPVVHKREIRFHKKLKKLQIIDRFEGEGDHHLEWNIILSPEFKGKLKIDSDKLQWRKEGAFYSKEYGVVSQTERLSSSVRTALPAEVTLSISMTSACNPQCADSAKHRPN